MALLLSADYVLGTVREVYYFILSPRQPREARAIMISLLQVRKPKLREMKLVGQGHRATAYVPEKGFKPSSFRAASVPLKPFIGYSAHYWWKQLLLPQKLRSFPPLCSPNTATVHRVDFWSVVAVQQGSRRTCLPGGAQLSASAMLGSATWAERHVENVPASELLEAAMPWIPRWLLPTRQSHRAPSGECAGQEAVRHHAPDRGPWDRPPGFSPGLAALCP